MTPPVTLIVRTFAHGIFVLGPLYLLAHQAGVSCPAAAAESDAMAAGEAKSSTVRIVVGFDGSCPHDLAGVRQEGPGRFRTVSETSKR